MSIPNEEPGAARYTTEEEEWLLMTPAQRFEESGKLWALYLSLGGSLDPEPDPQSPFCFSDPPDMDPLESECR